MTGTGGLLLRADAGPEIGAGHLLRCLALGQAWRDLGRPVTLATARPETPLAARFGAEGIDLRIVEAEIGTAADAAATARLCSATGALWTAVDGYRFDSAYQHRLADASGKLLWIDDEGHAAPYTADLVLNQNLSADEGLYARRGPRTELLLGTRYALLRREFAAVRPRPIAGRAERLLVTLGAGEHGDGAHEKVSEALDRLGSARPAARWVMGPLRHAHPPAVPEGVEIVHAVERMAELFEWADLALSSAGTTAYELAAAGVPTLLLPVARNQEPSARALAGRGAARDLGRADSIDAGSLHGVLARSIDDPEARAALRRSARRLVDGEGAARVALRQTGERLRVRPVREEDRELLFAWVNDAAVRHQSLSRETVPWERHVEWFAGRRAEPPGRDWIGVDRSDRAIGQVRFDPLGGDRWEISVSVAEEHRGRGLGTELVTRAIDRARRELGGRGLRAHVRPDNSASRRLFERAGFVALDRRVVRGSEVLAFDRSWAGRSGDASDTLR